MGGEELDTHETVDRAVPDAFSRWSRSVFAAPRRAAELITGIQHRDEVIERLVTRVKRREIREVRTQTSERRSTASRLDRGRIDPFAFDNETLRVASQYVAQCSTCAASGRARCDTCGGACTVACWKCAGSGKQRSDKTNRLINCKVCKKIGRMPCGNCLASGSIACRSCAGSGHQLAWLTFDETEHWLVSISPQSPIVSAHRSLGEARPLDRNELSAFSVVEEARRAGGVELAAPYRTLPMAQQATIDARLERVTDQQYLRLAVVRRDVTYEMSGTMGTVVLSGTDLVGSATPDAIRPIRRRLHAWLLLVALVAIVATLLRTAFVGSSSYFENAKSWTAMTAVLATLCAVPTFGNVLRAWRGGRRFRNPGRLTAVLGACTVAGLVAIALVGLVARPSVSEVDALLTAGNVAEARLAVEALKEYDQSVGVLEAEDRVTLREAATKTGNERLALLDAVAARKGPLAAGAGRDARDERLSQIRSVITARDPDAALAAIDRWFPKDTSVEIGEERARAHELRIAACSIDSCRLAAAMDSNSSRTTDSRASQVRSLRARLWDALAVERITEKSPANRLHHLRDLAEQASSTLASVANDAELRTRASAANEFVKLEREKVPLLGMDMDVATELFGPPLRNERNVPMFSLEGITVYLSVSKAGKCVGVFAVGSTSANRALRSPAWSPERILSQTLGRPVSLRPPGKTATTTWSERGVPVVVRWRDGESVELRIGDAMP